MTAHVVFDGDADGVVTVKIRNLAGDVVPLVCLEIHVMCAFAQIFIGHGMVALVIQLNAHAQGFHTRNMGKNPNGNAVPLA